MAPADMQDAERVIRLLVGLPNNTYRSPATYIKHVMRHLNRCGELGPACTNDEDALVTLYLTTYGGDT